MKIDKSRIRSCVDHINTAIDVDPWAKELVIEMGAEILKQLNNSTQEAKNANDCISKQGAIDALEKVADLFPWRVPGKSDTYDRYNEAWNDAIGRAEMEIENLPSVQPQRTCVNCGRTANNGGWYADGRTRCPIEEHYALPKDGFCHLWEKRNVTDDDYPERREE